MDIIQTFGWYLYSLAQARNIVRSSNLGISKCFRSGPEGAQGARANQWPQLSSPRQGGPLSSPGRGPGPSSCMAAWAKHWADHARPQAPSHFFLSLPSGISIWSLGYLAHRRKQRSRELLSRLAGRVFLLPSLPYLLGSPSSSTPIRPSLVILYCKRREEHLSAICRNHRAPTARSLSSSLSKLPRLPRPLSRSSRSVVCEPLRYVFLFQARRRLCLPVPWQTPNRQIRLRAVYCISNGLLHSTLPSRTLPCPPTPPVTTASP